VLNGIITKVRSHFLIHSGAVSYNGRGIVIAADSGHGKTTLVLKLLKQGYKFLSDEMAALSRGDQCLYPFPRSLRLRPDTLELVGFAQAIPQAEQWLDKLLLDVEQIQPHCMGQAVPLGQLIILKNPALPHQEVKEAEAERDLGILLERLDNNFLAKVKQIEGILETQADTDRGYPLLRLRVVHRSAVLAQIEALCQTEQITLLDVIKRVQYRPTFENPAKLEAISPSQAAVELLRRFEGGHKSALLQEEFEGSSTQLFMELMALIGKTPCYTLSVGPLDEMVKLINGFVA